MSSTDPKVNNGESQPRAIRRIGLLSPTSGNLGNAAMQRATIANIRKRIPGIEILGITLDPADTRRRHGIEAFPLASAPPPFFSVPASGDSNPQAAAPLSRDSIKRSLKRTSVLRGFLRAARRFVRELSHTWAAARFVRKLDRVIIPGGSAVNDFWGGAWGHPWNLFKWSVLSRLFGVPVMFVSVGKSSLEQPLSRFFLRRSLRLAAYRSFRDGESQRATQALSGIPNDPIYPDLAFSYPLPIRVPAHADESIDRRLVVGVSPIAYCDPRAWPVKDERRYAAYLGQLAEFGKWLLRENYRVLFFTTDSPDIKPLEDLQMMLSGGGPMDAGAIRTLPPSTEQSPDSILEGLSAADLVVASRLHGVILSHLNSIPALALSFDPKVDAHMNAIDRQEFCLSIDHLQADLLIERFCALKTIRESEAAHVRRAAQSFRSQLDVQYDRILGLSASNPASANNFDQINSVPASEIDGVRAR